MPFTMPFTTRITFSNIRLAAAWSLAPCGVVASQGVAPSDTIRIEMGSRLLDGRVYQPHAARVRVRVGDANAPITSEWTNELTLGDSAGRPVMRWVTKGKRGAPGTQLVTWELRQTYDAQTPAPYGYHSTSSDGTDTRLTITGNRVQGTRRLSGSTTVENVDITLDKPGFFAGASDLVPAAVGFKVGSVMTAPMWSPTFTKAEMRAFTAIGKATVEVEGNNVEAWKVDEHRLSDRKLLATWYLLDKSPCMVYGEVPLANGQVRRMTEVEIPMTKAGR